VILLGEENAIQLGVNVERLKWVSYFFASLLTAASVSVCGLIGFVGLIVPHSVRLIFGPDHRLLLPASALLGLLSHCFGYHRANPDGSCRTPGGCCDGCLRRSLLYLSSSNPKGGQELMINAHSISFRYHHDWVLQDVSFDIKKGEFLGIIGPNGSGKTSLLKILYRLLAPQKGEILYSGVPLQKMTRGEIAKKIAVVPQEAYSLFPFRVMEIVLMGRSPYLGNLLFESKKDLEIARRALEWTDTLAFLKGRLMKLSGGERKRVFIARALAQESELILLDEPTATLDIHHQVDFLQRMLDLNREKGLTLVMASHDMNLASEFCDRLILLKKGRIDHMGPSRGGHHKREAGKRLRVCDRGGSKSHFRNAPGNAHQEREDPILTPLWERIEQAQVEIAKAIHRTPAGLFGCDLKADREGRLSQAGKTSRRPVLSRGGGRPSGGPVVQADPDQREEGRPGDQ